MRREKDGSVSVSNGEWKIMELLWSREPRTLMEIVRELEPGTGWAKSTVATMLTRMAAKGLVRYEEGGRAKQYYALVQKEEAALRETRSLLARAYRGSVGLLMNTLAQNGELSEEDLKELRRVLEEAERD